MGSGKTRNNGNGNGKQKRKWKCKLTRSAAGTHIISALEVAVPFEFCYRSGKQDLLFRIIISTRFH